MRRPLACGGLMSVLFALLPLCATALQLNTVVSGLSSPLFVGHAGDGSNRLFIVEQAGTIRVLQPGSSTPTLFLDIHTKVVAGGEQGLLGLAFHPQYSSNGRFFVNYTQAGDGATVIAEYSVSADPNVADPASEKSLLVIAQPYPNHNGGMLAFGTDGYLYIGMGDGGNANDPGDRAQDTNVLLGKILRLDVDHPNPVGSALYSSPPTNPYYGSTAGRDEIYAIGLRNPWRFSFDRLTAQLYVGDVGQNAREEVDIVTPGRNYGWRVYEGFLCTNNDPLLCTPGNYDFPIFDYAHSGGRCSITGGYVYRGQQGALPNGTYIYGDYCTGEILAWNGTTQSVLLDTALNISSFGEDEAGELYVVGLGGTVQKLVTPSPCVYSITPTSQNFGAAGGSGSVNVTAGTGCPWTAVSNAGWIRVTAGTPGTGSGTVSYSVEQYTGKPRTRTGTMIIAGQTFTVKQKK